MFTVTKIAVLFTILAVWGDFTAEADTTEGLKNVIQSEEAQKCKEATGFDLSGLAHADESTEGLCFLKCVLKAKGVIDENGLVDGDVVDSIPFPTSKDKKEEMKQCMIEAGKIDTCEDMTKYLACSPRH